MKLRHVLICLCFFFSACSFLQGKLPDIFPPNADAACPDVPPACLPIICGATPVPTPTPTPTPVPSPTPPPPPGSGKVGQDYLGIMSRYWNVAAMLAALDTLSGPIPTGSLLDSFGYSEANHFALFRSGKTHKHRVHLLNSTCVTNGNCGASDKLRGYSKATLEQQALVNGSALNRTICIQATRVVAWKAQFPNIEFLISPLLEHHLSRSAASNVFSQLRSCVGPGIRLVDSHQEAYADIPDTIREQHGTNAIAPINSLDGNSVEDQDIERYKTRNAGAEMTLVWARSYNCRLEKGNFIQPDQRKDCPTSDQFLWFLLLQAPQDPVPTEHPGWCANPRPLVSPLLWKTAAENYGTGGPRENKPVYITRARQNQINIFNSKGGIIGFARYYGTFGAGAVEGSELGATGLYRYYTGTGSGDSARTLAEKARQQAGSSWVFMQETGGCWILDALRRGPTFHE